MIDPRSLCSDSTAVMSSLRSPSPVSVPVPLVTFSRPVFDQSALSRLIEETSESMDRLTTAAESSMPRAMPRPIITPTSLRNTRDGEWIPSAFLTKSSAFFAALTAALTRSPAAEAMPLAMPLMMFRPTLPQLTLVKAFLMLEMIDGILPTSCGIADTRPDARVTSSFTPVERICGRWLAMVLTMLAMICGT